MRYLKEFLAVFFLAGVLLPSAAAAQMMCGERVKGVIELKQKFSEEPVAMGLASNGEVIELFTSRSGSFTILRTRPDGISCLILSGESWEEVPVRIEGVKS